MPRPSPSATLASSSDGPSDLTSVSVGRGAAAGRTVAGHDSSALPVTFCTHHHSMLIDDDQDDEREQPADPVDRAAAADPTDASRCSCENANPAIRGIIASTCPTRPLHAAGSGLVRHPCARPALAAARRRRLGGAGQRGHAPADAGRSSRCPPTSMDAPLADPGRTGASKPPGEAVRMWGRLGYPRRALRLHQAAISDRGRLRRPSCPPTTTRCAPCPASATTPPPRSPRSPTGSRHVVLDTNVRRVLARVVAGVEFPAKHLTTAERELATERRSPTTPRRPRAGASA